MKAPLYRPQVEIIKLVEKHIAARSGKVLTVRCSRQTSKNECSATIQARVLSRFSKIGGIYLRTAPTWKPQIVISKQRLELMLERDPLTKGKWKRHEGFIYKYGNAQIHFLSSEKTSNVLGATASIALDCDEAHKLDKGKFEEELNPMRAFYNVPAIFWGVAADKQDLLYEWRQYNETTDPSLNIQFPAPIWAELRPEYAAHFEEQLKKYGRDHPYVRTQYLLEDIDAVSNYLKTHHQTSLFSGEHIRQLGPDRRRTYIAALDIAGEDEEELDSDEGQLAASEIIDDSVLMIAELVPSQIKYGLTKIRVVQMYWWHGKNLGVDKPGVPSLQTVVEKVLRLWKPIKTVVDGRGIGQQLASGLRARLSNISVYKATSEKVSEDCYNLLAWLNNEQLQMFRNDGTPEFSTLMRQASWTPYEVKGHERMRIFKPSPNKHIDFIKTLQYLCRAVGRKAYGASMRAVTDRLKKTRGKFQ